MNRSLFDSYSFYRSVQEAGFIRSLHEKCYGDLRNSVANLKSRRPYSIYWTCRNTGKDVTLKVVHRESTIEGMRTKVDRFISNELDHFFDSPEELALQARLLLDKPLTWDAIRLRKKRLLDRLKSFVSFSSNCYFFTITAAVGDNAVSKEDFLYAFENVRKAHQKLYGKMHYVGVLERHPKRKKQPFHAHFCAFFEGGWKPYEELWQTIGKLGRIDLEPVRADVSELANYASKSLLGTIQAYMNKTAKPESILLSSKGSPKPVVSYPTEKEVGEMLKTGKFEERTFELPTGGDVHYFKSESWDEMHSIFMELNELNRQEQELLAEQFINPNSATHRR